MGDLIDTKKVDEIYRCVDVKEAIVYINLIGPPISLLLLLFAIIRMIYLKKRKGFLTKIILIIFISEMVQCISKMLQMVKYLFEDERDNKKIDDLDLDRGIICQIQIVLAISSDFCSLLSTLLLTLRVYDVIKNKKKFFDQDYVEIICISLDIGISIILGIIFLMIDRYIAEGNVSYRYDVRDRCTYWCWLEHISSLICFGFYVLILIFNIFYAFKTYCFLRKGYIKLLEEADFPKNSKFVSPLGDIKSQVSESEENNSRLINTSKEEIKKIQNLNLMRLKSLIYPLVTIIYWTLAAIYRIVDDSFMMQFDIGDDPDDLTIKEQQFFEEYPSFQTAVQLFLVAYTFLSSIRGILYGFSFIVFEEKIFFNFFRKIFSCCTKDDELLSEDDCKNPDSVRNTEMSQNNDTEEDNSYKKKFMEKEMTNKEDGSEDE